LTQDTEDFHNTEGYERTTILRDIGVAVGELHDREQTPLFIADRVWNHIKAAFSLLDHLCLLRRLTDGNNPETVQRPLPDGTNLEFPALRSSWVLHRAWIRALHYRSLHAGAQDYGVKHIRQVLALSMVLLDGEVARRSSGDADYPIEFHSFSQCSYSLITALNGVLSDLLTDPRPAQEGVEYTPEETLLFNIESDRMVSIYKTVRQSSLCNLSVSFEKS
jgi:hypothetical protein